jgi:hypothetical protein
VVPADSQQIPRARCYSGTLATHTHDAFTYRTLTVYGRPFQTTSANTTHTGGRLTDPPHKTPQHPTCNPCQVSHTQGLATIRFRSPLLTESLLFSSPTGTEMFHFPAFPPHQLYIHQRVTAHNHGRVSPFGHPRINAQLATPRGISQPLTSFIGSLCQGIHRAPFTDNTKTNKDDSTKLHKIKKILASTIQFSNNTTPTPNNHTTRRNHQTRRCPHNKEHAAPDTQQRNKPTSTPHHTTQSCATNKR